MHRRIAIVAAALTAALTGFAVPAHAGPDIGAPNTLASAVNVDGRVELFRVNQKGVVEHVWQSKVDGPFGEATPFDDETRDPAPFTTLAVGKNKSGRLEVFAVKSDGTLWHRWQREANGAAGWAGWENMDGNHMQKLVSRVAVGSNSNGTLSVYVTGADDARIYRKWQMAADGGWIAGWSPFSYEPTRQLAATTTQDGTTALVGVSTKNVVSHWLGTGNTPCAPIVSGPAIPEFVSVATGGDRRIVLFATGADGSVGRIVIGVGTTCATNPSWAEVLPARAGRGPLTAYQMTGGRLAAMAQQGTSEERYDTATESYSGTLSFTSGMFGWGIKFGRR